MIVEYFEYVPSVGLVIYNNNMFLHPEFAALLSKERNATKNDPHGKKYQRAIKELTYIWLANSPDSIYSELPEQEAKEKAKLDSGITEIDSVVLQAEKKYVEIINTDRNNRTIKVIESSIDNILSLIKIDNNTSLEDINVITDAIEKVLKLTDSVNKLKEVLKKAKKTSKSIRGKKELSLIEQGLL